MMEILYNIDNKELNYIHGDCFISKLIINSDEFEEQLSLLQKKSFLHFEAIGVFEA